MAKRQAILIANSVAYGQPGKTKRVAVARTILKEVESSLHELGEYSFRVNKMVDENRDDAYRRLRELIRKSRDSDLLLIYYFGHAVCPPPPNDGLYLYFRDSDWVDNPSMLDFNDIVRFISSYPSRSVALILDCCYAGAVAGNIQPLNSLPIDYFVLASVSHKGRAQVDESIDTPMGVFSRYILNGFTNPGARTALSTNVTFQSFTDFVKSNFTATPGQLPFSIDGGLGNKVFFTQSLETPVPNEIRRSVPIKSAYFKLYRLLDLIHREQFPDDYHLYAFMSKNAPREFLTPVKVARDRIEYRPIGEDAFYTYIHLGRILGIISQGIPVSLTALGEDMRKNRGARFNSGLYSALLQSWEEEGISIADIHKSIGQRLSNNGIPEVDSVFLDLYITKGMRMSKTLFRIFLDLTAYVGALRYSGGQTYFLPAPPK